MALDVYFREDIVNILRSVSLASEGPAVLLAEIMQDPELKRVALDKLLEIYRRGFATALGAVGLAVGAGMMGYGQLERGTRSSLDARRNAPVLEGEFDQVDLCPSSPNLTDLFWATISGSSKSVGP